jgi:hypothetical protein
MKKMVSYTVLLLSLSGCFQVEQTPERLILGYYKLNNSEGIKLLSDSIAVMYFNYKEEEIIDTLKFKYRHPIYDENVISVGDIFFRSSINQNSQLYKYCQKMNCDESHLVYTLRYGEYMLLPNPESTELSYELVNE